MRYSLIGFGLFGFLVLTLFTVTFQEVPSTGQYGFGVLWSAVAGWSVAVIARRMARGHGKR